MLQNLLFVSGVGIRKGLGIGEKSWAKAEFQSKDVLIPCFSKVFQSKNPFSQEADVQSLPREGFFTGCSVELCPSLPVLCPSPECGSWGGRIEPQRTQFKNL